MSGGSNDTSDSIKTFFVGEFEEELNTGENNSISGFFTLPGSKARIDSQALMGSIPFASNRYQMQSLLGEGGMSHVYRVFDRVLNRSVAMKVIRQNLAENEQVERKFYEEAQATAQLQHPSIVPVYEMGKLPNGHFYFTMKEVRGKTLGEIIQEVHRFKIGSQWNETSDGWTFRRLINALVQVCEAVSHAHQCGVVHRDLKPDNIMLGSFGEVLVLDWGIAKIHEVAFEQGDDDAAATIILSTGSSSTSRRGSVAGTPMYMAPEQAQARNTDIGPHSDIYALGGILYEIMSGSPPRSGNSKQIILSLVNNEPVEMISEQDWLPTELTDLCHWALQLSIEKRPQQVTQFSKTLLRWLDGAQRREQALQLVHKASSIQSEVSNANLLADQLVAIAKRESLRIPSYAGIDHKRSIWKKEDEAKKARFDANILEVQMLEQLRTALNYDNTCELAHQALADFYHQRHRYYESLHMDAEAWEYEILLRKHERGRYESYLRGYGTLNLHATTPTEATLFRFERIDRRLEPVFVKSLGALPIEGLEVEMGSYCLKLSSNENEILTLPVQISRAKTTHLLAPKESSERPVQFIKKGSLNKNECYIHQGWTMVGSTESVEHPLKNVWVDGFVIQKFHVTNREYIIFLNDIANTVGLERAKGYAPSYVLAGHSQQIYGLREFDTGWEFYLTPDPQGDIWDLDWPIILVDYHCASAYAKWLSQKENMDWRLPSLFEWEKAARGVDGRIYPWGDHFEATWANVRESNRPGEKPLPKPVQDFAKDESPYGVRGMGGNAQDWCLELPSDAKRAPIRGCGWSQLQAFVPLHLFRVVDKSSRTETASFRLVRDLL